MKNKNDVVKKQHPLTPTQAARAQRTQHQHNTNQAQVAAATDQVIAAAKTLNAAVDNLNKAVAANANTNRRQNNNIKQQPRKPSKL